MVRNNLLYKQMNLELNKISKVIFTYLIQFAVCTSSNLINALLKSIISKDP